MIVVRGVRGGSLRHGACHGNDLSVLRVLAMPFLKFLGVAGCSLPIVRGLGSGVGHRSDRCLWPAFFLVKRGV